MEGVKSLRSLTVSSSESLRKSLTSSRIRTSEWPAVRAPRGRWFVGVIHSGGRGVKLPICPGKFLRNFATAKLPVERFPILGSGEMLSWEVDVT